MKLNKSKLLETLRRLNEGKTVYHARKAAGISVRRVYQIRQIYYERGEIPEIGKRVGHPIKLIE